MNLNFKETSGYHLPALAWVAKYRPQATGVLDVWCGDLTEADLHFVVEGVWPGNFQDLGFDESELFYGSGLRLVGEKVRFASSCSTVDRIWSHQDAGVITVSNSLPCLLCIADIDLVCDNSNYAKAVQTIVKGTGYQKIYPVSRGELRVHYFENLELENGILTVGSKPSHTGPFPDFQSYSSFLAQTAESIGRNAQDAARDRPVAVFSTISKGYDSPVASIMAKAAGARKAVTITSARSIFPRLDSGSAIASQLNMECEEYQSGRKKFRDELWYWAANGTLQDMNFSLFDYPPGPSVVFTGFNGDMVWSRSGGTAPDNWLKRKDSTGLGFCEHRLLKGVIHCPVPFWGIRNLLDIKKISEHAEMKPWSVEGDYDRPIPRRIAEEAGVSRALFGQKKSATTIDELLLCPLSSELMREYLGFLRLHHQNRYLIKVVYSLRRVVDFWRSVLRERVLSYFSNRKIARQWSRTFIWEDYLFPWANQKLKPKSLLSKDTGESGR